MFSRAIPSRYVKRQIVETNYLNRVGLWQVINDLADVICDTGTARSRLRARQFGSMRGNTATALPIRPSPGCSFQFDRTTPTRIESPQSPERAKDSCGDGKRRHA
jgi:hypothetical protein